ncbi:uncharacterized protein PF3D7_1120600-like [Diorhabda carinulata]|uniref:uncharacterized protein PF3D7_1120600-like n=1 Tax=Diorhabda carinulata TaxID=1163345 RepID=UPI0025A22A30|nr:uncharacterized protein PF3D7_1120600-like [Diorhabda carinulata]
MMSCIYNKNLVLPVINQHESLEEKNLNIIIISGQDSLKIKIRDPSEYTFNYSENIDLGNYELMRLKQNLDINFNEFKTNLLEMLAQLQKREMFLRCETSDQLCTMVFFNKSKIKSIIYLTVELHAANQKEVLDEMINSLQCVKDSNEKLQLQMTCMKKSIADKDKEIKHLNTIKYNMEKNFHGIINEVEELISTKAREVECLLLRRIKFVADRIIKILNNVNSLQHDTHLRINSTTSLLKNMERLKIENRENLTSIEHLREENNILQAAKLNLEKNLTSIRNVLTEREIMNRELQNKNEELQSDMEKATIVLAQKKSTVDELTKDLVQANQMLVNFNHHYDIKVKELENMQAHLINKNRQIEEERAKHFELQGQFENYKIKYNEEIQENMKRDLCMAQNKIEELEQALRKANKINALLSEKVNKITR